MSVLIQNVLLDGVVTDIALRGGQIERVAPGISGTFETVLDGTGKLAIPPFYNTHCHAAMSLLRGIADDMELFEWLSNHIWPAEAKLTGEDIYHGSRLAILEMIKSGTVFFNDMYFHPMQTVRAAEELGVRAAIGMITLDSASPASRAQFQAHNEELWEKRGDFSGRITLALSPHAIYTVEEGSLRAIAEGAAREDLPIHIHIAETAGEVEACRAAHGGMTPAEYLDSLGLLTSKTLAAHAIHLTDSDIDLLKERGVSLAYMPCSNYKLSSGRFRFRRIADAGCRITFGTDGCASNNSLSMFDEMKVGALGAKIEHGGPAACHVNEILHAATRGGASAFGLNAGVIAEGAFADVVLLDLNSSLMVADHNLTSNVVYSADSSCVDTVICDGRILMRGRVVPGEREIVESARAACRHLR